MPLTKDFKVSIKARAERDPEFRAGLFREAIEAMLSDDLETGKVLLRDYVNATVGFEALAQDMNKDPKSLMRMLSAKGNPRADNLLMGWMAPAPTGVAMRHSAGVDICLREEPPHASYHNRPRSCQERFSGSRDHRG